LNTLSYNLAPSVCSIRIPSTSRVPSGSTPSARQTALLRTVASSRILTRSASKKTTGYIGSSGRLCHAVISAATSSVTWLMNWGGDLDTVNLGEKALDVAHRHAAGVHRDDLVVEAAETASMLGNDLRLEAVIANARHIDAHWLLFVGMICIARKFLPALVGSAKAVGCRPNSSNEPWKHCARRLDRGAGRFSTDLEQQFPVNGALSGCQGPVRRETDWLPPFPSPGVAFGRGHASVKESPHFRYYPVISPLPEPNAAALP